MRVLHIIPSISRSFGGPVESLIGYAKAAGLSNVDIHIAAPGCDGKDLAWFREQLPETTVYPFTSYGRHAWIMSPGLWKWLRNSGKGYYAIHIHGLFNPVSSYSASICRMRGLPYVIRPFGTLSRYTFSRTKWFKQPWFRYIDRANLRAAKAVHFTTEEEYLEAGRLDLSLEKKKVVIPPPYRGVSFQDSSSHEKFSEPAGLYLSRLHPIKNIESLLHAWKHVMEVFPSARLQIAGNGDEGYVNSLKNLVKELMIYDSVDFLGFVTGEQKKTLLNKSWIFVLPSHHENFGVAVLEAVAAGLPVIVSKDVQLAGFVKATETGIVTGKEPSDIAGAIEHLFRNKRVRKRCSVQGPESVQASFSLERVGKQLVDMYGDVASKS